MGTIRVRFITVALVVSFFAVGMAAFLNYFKYKSTIENSIQASLALGLQFTELATLPSQMEREKASDKLIQGIDVFDDTGQIIYSTDSARVGQRVQRSWTEAAARSKTTEWTGEGAEDYVAGISLKNNFDLTVGYLALRYSRDYVDRAASAAARQITLAALGAFAGIALIAPLALIVVIRRFERDLQTLETAAVHLEDKGEQPALTGSAFDSIIDHLRASLRDANAALDDLRAKLDSSA